MKKVIFIMMLILVSLTLKAEEPIIRFYLQDGSSTQYKLEDIEEMNFINSNSPYMMQIFVKDLYSTNEIKDISSIQFSHSDTLIIVNSEGWISRIAISIIDSINFIPYTYYGILIGTQTWMGKNLDVDHYRNGDPIPQVTDSTEWGNLKTGAWCYYDNNPGYGVTFGKLYNWYAVHDPRGLAPEGWHIPSYTEWMRLTNSLGGEKVAGGKMKSIRPEWWKNPNKGATNESRFTALPGGYRYLSGAFFYLGEYGCWWSSSAFDPATAWYRELSYDAAEADKYNAEKEIGFSVRCVKDLGSDIPTINSILPVSGAVGDIITITGSAFGEPQGTSCVSFNLIKLQPGDYQSWSDSEIKIKVPMGAATGSVTVTVNGLQSNEVDFTFTGTNHGEYDYVAIGSQVWMTTNLNVDHYRNGDPIPEVADSAKWEKLTTGAWCHYKSSTVFGTIYGKLYNWYAVNDPRGLAPVGWHVASDPEWNTLSAFLGGMEIAGGKLKEAGLTHWQNPNTAATNESGFTALPGGYRYTAKSFSRLGYDGYWWSSTVFDDSTAKGCMITNSAGYLLKTGYPKNNGLSVRCIVGIDANTPTINSITPFSAEVGEIITISGTCFGSKRGISEVSFNTLNPLTSDYQSWSDTEIKVKVPIGAVTGKVSVTVNGTKSNESDFTVTNFMNPPHITSISPSTATIGDVVTLYGENFGAYQDKSFVSFDSICPKQSEYLSWEETEIKVKVPPGSSTGKVTVTVNVVQSNEVDFTVIYYIENGTVTDIDGNIYKTIKIDNKWWMVENLTVTHYRNGNPITQVTVPKEWENQSTGGWCYYNNQPSNGPIYGKLYNWYAVNDARGLAPEGWHVATDEEWTKLSNFLGGEIMAAGKMKSTGTIEKGDGLWYKPNTGASNIIGFSALPGGSRSGDGTFSGRGYEANWWRPASGSVSGAWYRSMNYNSVEVFRIYDDKVAGFSVRCVKD